MTDVPNQQPMSTENQKNLICGILLSFLEEDDSEGLFGYLRHCGLPPGTFRSAADILPAFLGLYRIRPGHYDVERACMDLRWWPPIATRIAQLEAEAAGQSNQGTEARKLPDDL